ncbi:MAG: diguanylate cyclase [Myxococcales bacterium]|jgi:diguanylate cyclase (GGDEF)-like protein|nr:diguanylate cyclase [Myxococcales bacterium]
MTDQSNSRPPFSQNLVNRRQSILSPTKAPGAGRLGTSDLFEPVEPSGSWPNATIDEEDDSIETTRVTKFAPHETIATPSEACLVQIYGPELGKRYALNVASFSVGRDLTNNIVVDLDNVSRRHCVFANRGGKIFLADLDSTNGTFLNGEELAAEKLLSTGDLIKVGSAIFKFLYGGNLEALYYEEIYQMTIIDGLTQVHNKRYFLEFLEREMSRCRRYDRDLALLMFDIDHFKKVNDTYGHLAGDAVLRRIGTLLKTRVRREECFARYGGEEFALVLPESGVDAARNCGERFRALVAEHEFSFEGTVIPITISIGLALMAADMADTTHFIKQADTQLYRAKHEGRNRVCGP